MAMKTIFLESAFWDKFSECSRALNPYAEGGDPVGTFEKIERWNSIYKFICRSSVFVDSPLPNLAEKAKSDPMLRHLLKCNGDGRMELSESEDPFPDLESDKGFEFDTDYSSLYFTAEDHSTAAKSHGVINICCDNIWNQQDKFKDTGEAVKTDKGFAWNKMEILREASNGMVIADNFVLSPDKRTGQCSIRYDLRELLRLMLPDSFKEDYVLSIFYFDDSDDDAVLEARKRQFYQSIRDFVKVKKKGLNLVLELFPTTANGRNYHKDFHDRSIITNNVWIGSEAGFDLLVQDYSTNTNTRAIKTTKTHGLYLGFGNDTANWLEEAYDDFISEAKQCLRRYGYKTENRILF